MHDVRWRNRQLRGARHEIDVDPGVNAKSCRMTLGKDARQGIEARRPALEIGRARLEAACEIGVASAPDLNEQRVESILARGSHQRRDRLRRSERRAKDPERARFGGSSFARGDEEA